MRIIAKKILQSCKGTPVEVYIDDANMFHAQKETNIWIDWSRFQKLLKKYFPVKFINYYRGKYPKSFHLSPEVTLKNELFVKKLNTLNFKVIQRDLKKIFTTVDKTKFIYKCDFDGEIGFDIAAYHKHNNLVIIVSGDSDFVFVKHKKINALFICFEHKAPWEIRHSPHIFIEDIVDEIKKPRHKDGVNITRI